MNSRTAALLEDLRHLLEGGARVQIHADGGGFYAYPPNPVDSQEYDSHLVGDNNGKMVQKLAAEALKELLQKGGHPTSSEVFDFVDEYVMKHGGKRARPVRWNSKSYPD